MPSMSFAHPPSGPRRRCDPVGPPRPFRLAGLAVHTACPRGGMRGGDLAWDFTGCGRCARRSTGARGARAVSECARAIGRGRVGQADGGGQLVAFHAVARWWPCARMDCPCPALWNGGLGEFCCLMCRDGVPCRAPLHVHPFGTVGNYSTPGPGPSDGTDPDMPPLESASDSD